MRTSQTLKIALGIGILGCGVLSRVLAQGPLNPAGAPAPSMKTLGQMYTAVELVEPRTALSFANTPGMSNFLYAVTNSGSYYLTEDTAVVNGGILVLADDVTIDLCGFKLEGTPANAYDGISFPGCDHLAVRNGIVARFGKSGLSSGSASTGVGFSATDLRVLQNVELGILASVGDSQVIRCSILSNGEGGVELSRRAIVVNTIVQSNVYDGIYVSWGGVLTGNTCEENGWAGLRTAGYSVVQGNALRDNGHQGVDAGQYSVVQNNTASDNAGTGIKVTFGSQVRNNVCVGNNTGLSSIGGGIFLQTGSQAVGNTLYTNSVQGIYVWSPNCVVEDNAISESPTGITFKVSGSLYVNNRFSGLGTDVDGTATDGGGNISF